MRPVDLLPLLAAASLTTAYAGGQAGPQALPQTVPPRQAPQFLGGGGPYPFSEAVRVGGTLYLSGQVGTSGGQLVKGGVQAETRQAIRNIEAALHKQGYRLSDLVKCTVMLADMNDFAAMNEVYRTELAAPYPARSTLGVSGLALGARVEIECIAAR